MPLQSPTAPTPLRARLPRAAIVVAASCTLARRTAIALADDQLAPQVRTIAEPTQPVAARYFEVEANKANSMRALGRHLAEQRANRTPGYQDLEANKARSQRPHCTALKFANHNELAPTQALTNGPATVGALSRHVPCPLEHRTQPGTWCQHRHRCFA